MALTPEQIKKMDEIFKQASGGTPKELSGTTRPPIEERAAQLKSETQPKKQGFFQRGSNSTEQLSNESMREDRQETIEDIKQFGSQLKEISQETMGNVREDIDEFRTTDQSRTRGALRVAGEFSRGVSNIIGSAITGAGKVLLSEKEEEKVQESFENLVAKASPVVKKALEDTGAKDYWENLAPEVQQDIKDVLSIGEVAAEFTGLGTASKGAKVAGEVAEAGIEAGTRIAREAREQVIEAGAKKFDDALSGIATKTKGTTKAVKEFAEPYTTSVKKQRDQRITRALDLVDGDLNRFEDAFGQKMPEFIAENNLIGNTVEETMKKAETFKNTSMAEVRDVISQVDNLYDVDNIPRYERTIQELQSELLDKNNEVLFGAEDLFNEIDDLARIDTPRLADVQKLKELLDDVYDIYKKDGTAKSSRRASNLANVRQDIKEFIEREVKRETGTDIAPVNSNVAKAFNVAEAIQTRAGKSLTKSPVNIGDFTTFGATTGVFAPLAGPFAPVLGVIGLTVKRLIENPTVRLRIAKALNKIEANRAAKIIREIEEEAITPDTARFIKDSIQISE